MKKALFSVLVFSSLSFANSGQYLFDNVMESIKRDYQMICTEINSKKYHCHTDTSTLLGFEVSLSRPFFLFRFLAKGKSTINFKYMLNSMPELFELDPAQDKSLHHNQLPYKKGFYGRQLSLDTLQLLSDKKTADCTEFTRKLENYSGPGDEEYNIKTIKGMHYQGSVCRESNGNEIKFNVLYNQSVIQKIMISE